MTVLYIIGILAVVFSLYIVVRYINEISERFYKYEFFNYGNLTVVTIAYVMIYFGRNWYMDALAHSGDILNGILLMGIGTLIILILIYQHIKHTSIFFGLFFGFIQLIIYIPAGIISFFGAVLMAAWLMDTKPVYRL